MRRLIRVLLFILAVLVSWSGSLGSAPAIVPDQVIELFNGKDLTNFYTWQVDYGRADPKRVFTVVDEVDGAPVVRISGENWGGLVTRESFRNFRLLVEFRWGLATWGVRKGAAKDSGILFHCQGPDGNSRRDNNGPWMSSLETQIIEGGVGDFICVQGYDKQGVVTGPVFTVTASKRGNDLPYFDPDGHKMRIDRARVNWWGRDPNWKDLQGFRGARDIESPAGEWTRVEVVCDGSQVTNIVNGVVVNALTESTFTEGKILFQSEGAEIFFRRIELHPLEVD